MLTLRIYRKSAKEYLKESNKNNELQELQEKLDFVFDRVNLVYKVFDSHDIDIKTLASELIKTNKKLHELQQSNDCVEKRVYNHYNSFV